MAENTCTYSNRYFNTGDIFKYRDTYSIHIHSMSDDINCMSNTSDSHGILLFYNDHDTFKKNGFVNKIYYI